MAATTPAAGGERFIVAEGPCRWEDFGAFVTKVTLYAWLPDLQQIFAVLTARNYSTKVPSLKKTYDPSAEYMCTMNTKKALELLGMTKYHSKEETTQAILVDYAARGWL